MRKRPKNKRGKYALREIEINQLNTYDWADRNALISAVSSFMHARRDFDPRYLVVIQETVLRVADHATMLRINAMSLRDKIKLINSQLALERELGIKYGLDNHELDNF